MSDDAIIVDRGYRTWDGERGGIGTIRWAITVDALRRAFGLGRRARAKIFPWAMLALASLIALVVTGLYVAAGVVAGGLPPELLAELPSHAELFGWYSAIALVFVAAVGPGMLIPERRDGTLGLVLSRPLTVNDYLLAKALAYVLVVGSIQVVPQLVLWIGRAAVATDALAYVSEAGPVLWQVPVVAAATLLAQGTIMIVAATWINRPGIAAAAFLGVWAAIAPIMGELSGLDVPGARFLALGNVNEHSSIVGNWVFGEPQGITSMRSAGFDPWLSAVIIVVLAVAAAVMVQRRYRSLA